MVSFRNKFFCCEDGSILKVCLTKKCMVLEVLEIFKRDIMFLFIDR